jgi:histidinol phosphatase-like enzyme (inositol monophosphatase family)
MQYERELAVAKEAAESAGREAMRFWRNNVAVETKEDDSPVSAADRGSERVIVEALTKAFPADGLVGEEGARKESSSGRRWIIDPVDGTRDFVRGSRQWAVQLAVEEGRDNVLAGVVHFPALDETYYASQGGGAFLNGEPIRVSNTADISKAVLCVNDLDRLAGTELGDRFVEWASRFWCIRNPGGSPDAMMVASGIADGWIEPDAKEWDMAPHKIVTEEAGGVFRNFNGGSSIYGGDCITCNPFLAGELARFVAAR